MASFLAGAVIMAPLIARLISEPFGKLFYSGEEFDRPQPMYSVPEGKRKKGLYREAFDGYLQIAREYPRELKPHLEMLKIAMLDLKDKEQGDLVFQQAIAALDDKEARDALLKMYEALNSKAEYLPRPSDPIPLKHRADKSSG